MPQKNHKQPEKLYAYKCHNIHTVCCWKMQMLLIYLWVSVIVISNKKYFYVHQKYIWEPFYFVSTLDCIYIYIKREMFVCALKKYCFILFFINNPNYSCECFCVYLFISGLLWPHTCCSSASILVAVAESSLDFFSPPLSVSVFVFPMS